MTYWVKYEDNTGEDCLMSFDSEEAADTTIEDELHECMEFFQSVAYDYTDNGKKVEFWVCGGDEYASWDRLWIE